MKYSIIKKNGKFYTRVSNHLLAPFWPYPTTSEFNTLAEAKVALFDQKRKNDIDYKEENEKETVVFEL